MFFGRKNQKQRQRQRPRPPQRFRAKATVNVAKEGTSRLGVLHIISGYAHAGDRLYVHSERKDKDRIILYMHGPNRSYACSAVLQNGNFGKGDVLRISD